MVALARHVAVSATLALRRLSYVRTLSPLATTHGGPRGTHHRGHGGGLTGTLARDKGKHRAANRFGERRPRGDDCHATRAAAARPSCYGGGSRQIFRR